MVTISGNTDSAPLIGSEVIQNCRSDGSVWSEKGSSDPRFDTKPDTNCDRSEADRTSHGVKRYLKPEACSSGMS